MNNRKATAARLTDITASIRARGVRVPEEWRVLARPPARPETSDGQMIIEGRPPVHSFPTRITTW